MQFPLNVPVLTDGEITLRAITPADTDALLEMALDPEMSRNTAIPQPYNCRDAEHFIASVIPTGWDEKNHRSWAIDAIAPDGQARWAGTVDIRDTPIATIGFALHPWARGLGVMSRAVRLAADWAFAEGGVEIIHWAAHVSNTSSLRVAHACGFALHTTMPGHLYERERVLDAWTASLKFGDGPEPKSRWAESPVMESERLRLRPFRPEDAPRIVEACSDPVSRHWLSHLPAPYTESDARAYIDLRTWHAARGAEATWCVAGREDDLLVGNLAVMDMLGADPGAGEIGYWMHPDARGQGLMTEATKLVIDHAFKPDGLDRRRLTLYAAVGNTASNKIARAAQMRPCGTHTQAERLGDGTYDDLNAYELLR